VRARTRDEGPGEGWGLERIGLLDLLQEEASLAAGATRLREEDLLPPEMVTTSLEPFANDPFPFLADRGLLSSELPRGLPPPAWDERPLLFVFFWVGETLERFGGIFWVKEMDDLGNEAAFCAL